MPMDNMEDEMEGRRMAMDEMRGFLRASDAERLRARLPQAQAPVPPAPEDEAAFLADLEEQLGRG